MKTMKTLFLTIVLSMLFSTTVMASSYESGLDPEWDAYMAERDQKVNTAKQNKAIYDATATKLQKKVDSLIEKYEQCENEAKAQRYLDELLNLYNSTPAEEWAVNYTLPSGYSEYLPNTVVIKVGYNFDNYALASGDLRTWMWYFEDGVFYGISANGYTDNIRWGSTAARIDWLINHPTSGSITLPSGEVYSWVGAD
ncbi:hypothetical protein [Butyrivibrio sp. AE2032]|uniref:hypothetical protein n=1 Tax=Butyrivibrio sp. AE2032 TaxID=1458463 RepID=UPI000556CD4D|nr:hypothetical protein [Butyrivibrio sp. AE2032]